VDGLKAGEKQIKGGYGGQLRARAHRERSKKDGAQELPTRLGAWCGLAWKKGSMDLNQNKGEEIDLEKGK